MSEENRTTEPEEKLKYEAPDIEEEVEFETTALATCPKLGGGGGGCAIQDSAS